MDLSPGAPAAVIKDTDEQSFEQDVLAASLRKPVIVDFWAPWCMPCKQLMPVLEKAVNAAQGAVLMVKVNIDQNQGLAQALRIQSVPAVYAFFQGKPVDGFAGVRPESEVTQFVSRLAALGGTSAPDPALDLKKVLSEGDQQLQQGNSEAAMSSYARVLDVDPENLDALGGIAWSLLSLGDVEAVRDMLSQLPEGNAKNARLRGVSFVLGLGTDADIAVLENDLAASPQKLQGYFDLARGYFSIGAIEKGIDTLITLIKKDREWNDKKARTLLLEVFDALGPSHPLTSQGRRKLSAVLFS